MFTKMQTTVTLKFKKSISVLRSLFRYKPEGKMLQWLCCHMLTVSIVLVFLWKDIDQEDDL